MPCECKKRIRLNPGRRWRLLSFPESIEAAEEDLSKKHEGKRVDYVVPGTPTELKSYAWSKVLCACGDKPGVLFLGDATALVYGPNGRKLTALLKANPNLLNLRAVAIVTPDPSKKSAHTLAGKLADAGVGVGVFGYDGGVVLLGPDGVRAIKGAAHELAKSRDVKPSAVDPAD